MTTTEFKQKYPQQKDKNREPYFTWTKKWGWRVNGYIKADKENEK